MSEPEFSAEGKTFLITGAASGLGAGFAERFLQEGAKHVAILDIAAEAGEATAARLQAEHGADRVSFRRCDITELEPLTQAFQDLVAKFKVIDVVINNAGILNDYPKYFRTANNVNWQGLTTLSMLAWQHMAADRGGAGGTLVNVSSIAALAPWPHGPIYSGAKAAVLHFSVCLGMEANYSRTRIRVLCMCYGQTQTPLMQEVRNKTMDEEMGKRFEEQESAVQYQSVAAAVEAMATMVRRGGSGSVWAAVHGAPVKDITRNITAAYGEIAKAFDPASN